MRTVDRKRAFAVLEGSPTITFATEGVERMLPYHSFVKGRLEAGRIALQFGDLEITIEGDALGELWENLQMQDVRSIRKSQDQSDPGECTVTRLSIRSASDSQQ